MSSSSVGSRLATEVTHWRQQPGPEQAGRERRPRWAHPLGLECCTHAGSAEHHACKYLLPLVTLDVSRSWSEG